MYHLHVWVKKLRWDAANELILSQMTVNNRKGFAWHNNTTIYAFEKDIKNTDSNQIRYSKDSKDIQVLRIN